MKISKIISASFMLLSIGVTAQNGSDSLGLPGDNLNLSGVLELFKKSDNPEEFEKALNKEDNKINNLDLNGDGEIDYLRVVDHSKEDAHALVIQVPVNETESQDVAVIEIEKNGNEAAQVQIIGDEDLYGKNYIVEPVGENVKSAESSSEVNKTIVVVNVWAWPSVRYIYRPSYVVWTSPWKWRYYPVWWKPWKPVHWHVYHPHWHHHHHYHHRVHVHRVVKAHNVYYGHRKVSKTVYQKRTPGKTGSVKQGRKNHNQVSKNPGKQRVKGTSGKRQGQKSGRSGKGAGQKSGRRK
ncbi:MAG: hypothetical protein M3R27_01880 [Bacteroidota bacterium]|nr:hypothetical protein [Bacteroidota bacterium]